MHFPSLLWALHMEPLSCGRGGERRGNDIADSFLITYEVCFQLGQEMATGHGPGGGGALVTFYMQGPSRPLLLPKGVS